MNNSIDVNLSTWIESGALEIPASPKFKRIMLRRILNKGAVIKRMHESNWEKISSQVELTMPFNGDKVNERFRISKREFPILLGELNHCENRSWLLPILFQLGLLYHQSGDEIVNRFLGNVSTNNEHGYSQNTPEIPNAKSPQKDPADLVSSELVDNLTSSGLIS
ncbi:hypothetical protein L8R84_22555 [Vibrio splendidus]|uniref:hypothetical protein n=1 Tax=Vibrio splendidus TaxID=29497 RepID=UPI0024698C31|nr:hypothetical protein [Vibrio splendidus]MDH5938891.1 hypothetical protein [Vibrio splendidus]